MHSSDPRALRALAHPVRLSLLEFLALAGAATAAECGRRLSTSQATCSFHLRQLAKYGYVQPAPASTDGRERPWQLTDIAQSWSADAGPAANHLDRVFVERDAARIVEWVARRSEEPLEWRDIAFIGGATLLVTLEEMESMRESLRNVLQPYVDRLAASGPGPEGARAVRFNLSGIPLPLDARKRDG